MRGLPIVLVILVAALIVFRLWLSTQEKTEMTRPMQIIWKAIDVALIAVAIVGVIVIVIVLITIAGQMLENIT